jgi:hypothetical protein
MIQTRPYMGFSGGRKSHPLPSGDVTRILKYSTTSRKRNPANRNRDEICLRVPHKNRNSFAWVLTTVSVSCTYVGTV